MNRHLVTLRIANSPLAIARLYGVLRARRVPFTVSTAATDDPRVLAVTVGTAESGPNAERIATYCRRLVDVTDVRCAGESACVVQESALIEVSLTVQRLSALLAAHPVFRVVASTGANATLAIAGPPASVTAAIAALLPSEIDRLQHGAPIAFVPPSTLPIPPALPEELH